MVSVPLKHMSLNFKHKLQDQINLYITISKPISCRHVVEACSFFKTNSQLLTGSNNIERKPSTSHNYAACSSRVSRPTTLFSSPSGSNEAPCRTCFSVRKKLHPPSWAQPPGSRHVLCDCATASEIFSQVRVRYTCLNLYLISLHHALFIMLIFLDSESSFI